jgi:adenylate kinase
MLSLSEYLEDKYVTRPQRMIKGFTEEQQKDIAALFKFKTINEVAEDIGLDYHATRRIYHKYRRS